ncbi:MAG TPA: hypothetical protein P5119_00955 [Candidatus Aminicenantes bacterium]|nr:hypothetical protein [Candidatus Aminicenantes bacterium]HRY63893.1 hypothetical protein [Candidatus Aminicenantes bacterium]HRZ70806.1 hypothetical protein [Candidatus Aminicenantes bacterium]
MRSDHRVLVFVVLAVGVLTLGLTAAGQEKKPRLFFVEDDVVKPAMASQFEAALKETVESVFKAYAWPWPFDVYATEDFHYYILYPFESLSEIDKGFGIWNEMLGKLGAGKWDALNRKMGETTEYVRQGTVTLSPELSYAPEAPGLKPEEVKFVYWGFCSVLPGKEKDFEEQLGKMVALYKARKVPAGFQSWIGGIGTEMPFYFYSETAKSGSDLFLMDEKVMKLIDPEATAIWSAMLKLMRKYESKMGAYRPDLSYAPSAKAK